MDRVDQLRRALHDADVENNHEQLRVPAGSFRRARRMFIRSTLRRLTVLGDADPETINWARHENGDYL